MKKCKIFLLSIIVCAMLVIGTISIGNNNDLSKNLSDLQMQLADLQQKLGKFPPPLPPRDKGKLVEDTRYQRLLLLQGELQNKRKDLKTLPLDGSETEPGLKQYLRYFTGIWSDVTHSVYAETDLPNDIKILGQNIDQELARRISPTPAKKEDIVQSSDYKYLQSIITSDVTEITEVKLNDILSNYTTLERNIKDGLFTITQMPPELVNLKNKAQAELKKREEAKKPSPSPEEEKQDIKKSFNYKYLQDRIKELNKTDISKVVEGKLKGILSNYTTLERNIKDGLFTITQMPSEFDDLKNKAQAEFNKREAVKKTYDLSTMSSKEKAAKRDELKENIKQKINDYRKDSPKYTKEQLQALSDQIEEYITVVDSIAEGDEEYEDADSGIMRFRVQLSLLMPGK